MLQKLKITLFLLGTVVFLSNCELNTQKKSGSSIVDKVGKEEYLDKGMEIAVITQNALSKRLLTAINKIGTDGALAFCSESAMPLTDSMALVLNAEIKRVSDKNRNIENGASMMELEYIKQAKEEILAKRIAQPRLHEMDNQMVGYYPIVTNGLCLKCHGNPEKDMDANTRDVLNERYPEDKAIGYGINELRGIWVISMDKS